MVLGMGYPTSVAIQVLLVKPSVIYHEPPAAPAVVSGHVTLTCRASVAPAVLYSVYLSSDVAIDDCGWMGLSVVNGTGGLGFGHFVVRDFDILSVMNLHLYN